MRALTAQARRQQHDALAEAVRSEALRQEGVVSMKAGCVERVFRRGHPGVTTRIDRQGWLHVDLSIVVRRETDLHPLGRAVQDAVRRVLGDASDCPIGQVNVHICGIIGAP